MSDVFISYSRRRYCLRCLRRQTTQVPSGERSYLKDLHEITAFNALYLRGMGVKLDMGWPVRP